MEFDLLTLFPEMFQGPLSISLLKKACSRGLLSFNLVNLRDFAADKHKTTDDSPYGGGSGMVMKVDVIKKAVSNKQKAESRIILMSPRGQKLTQKKVQQLAKEKHLIIICGHYEGVDERVRDYIDEEISIGDYVLTGGELPAMVLVDTIARYIPGVVKEEASVKNDSFHNGLLDYPSYTKPEDFEGKKVPSVLLSGNHREIAKWRAEQALKITLERRPDLL
ncbi:MAG: tRNA (guanosine(37)-N1)-methyltransferase TrmD, partial [Candidatus Margulisbacteria bacterium]|nr:tRNA (guanosine(37)-N1)-methyltransferase TrmD [Candidatus Margulisiibacteriota bacterium]